MCVDSPIDRTRPLCCGPVPLHRMSPRRHQSLRWLLVWLAIRVGLCWPAALSLVVASSVLVGPMVLFLALPLCRDAADCCCACRNSLPWQDITL